MNALYIPTRDGQCTCETLHFLTLLDHVLQWHASSEYGSNTYKERPMGVLLRCGLEVDKAADAF